MTNPMSYGPLADDEESQLSAQVAIGDGILDVLDVAYRARRSVLLEGPTGIGKSEVVQQFAVRAGIDVIVLDLSLLEPPDLIGLPVIRGDRTHYAVPSELPTAGRGVLMLEELNRAEIPVVQPALQLLSARRLHDYVLPPGWFCVAAVNPDDGDYQVNELDPAMRSRFLQIAVGADREAWLRWAELANVHHVIRGVVQEHEDALQHAPPRSWKYTSDLLHALTPREAENEQLLGTLLHGYLPTPWANLVASAFEEAPSGPALDVEFLLESDAPEQLAKTVASALDEHGRTDMVHAIASRLGWLLTCADLRAAAERGAVTLTHLERVAATLPGDLRQRCLDALSDTPTGDALLRDLGQDIDVALRGDCDEIVPTAELDRWREAGLDHRFRMLLRTVARSLARFAARETATADRDRARTKLARLGANLDAHQSAELGRLLGVHGLSLDHRTP